MTLPQLSAPSTITDGGLETALVYQHGIDLPDFAAFPLLDTEAVAGARRLLRAIPRPRAAARRRRDRRHPHVAGEPGLGRTLRLRPDPTRRRQPSRRRVRTSAGHQRTRWTGEARPRRRGRPARRRLRGRRGDVGIRGGRGPRPTGACLCRGRRGDDDRHHDDLRRRSGRRDPRRERGGPAGGDLLHRGDRRRPALGGSRSARRSPASTRRPIRHHPPTT